MLTGKWCCDKSQETNSKFRKTSFNSCFWDLRFVILRFMKIIPLSEGTFTVDKTKLFIPFDEVNDSLQQRSAGSLLVEIQPFAVITSKDILLLDTGLGFSNKEKQMQIHGNLAKEGTNSSNITKVLLTHLHKDHAG